MSERIIYRGHNHIVLCDGNRHRMSSLLIPGEDRGPCTCGADDITLIDRFSVPKYVSRGEETLPHPDHTHVFGWFRRKCKVCGLTRAQLHL